MNKVRTRLAVVATHPIQYHVPWYQALAAHPDLDLRVLFATLPDPESQGTGFGRPFEWDVPLLAGYTWERLENRRKRPTLDGFFASSASSLRLLRQLRPSAVVITGWNQWPLLQALFACQRLGIPAIVRGESNAFRSRPGWVTLAQRLLLRCFDGFLAIGSSNREFYHRAGVAPQRIVDCPYFVDNERFSLEANRLTPARACIRREWGISDDATVFAFVGKLQTKKRPQDLLEAGIIAHGRGARLHLLLVGTGDLEEPLHAAARRNDVPVTFAGFLNQSAVSKAYVACDALVLPSDDGETWGLVVNEAMACGRPALVSDRVGCGPDLVQEGRTGHRFPCGDSNALAALMARFAARPVELAAMGARARRRVREEFSVRKAVDATLEAVSLVVDGTRRRTPLVSPQAITGDE